jgi:hypothetical protein
VAVDRPRGGGVVANEAVLAWTGGAWLAIGLFVGGFALAAYAIYYLVFKFGK